MFLPFIPKSRRRRPQLFPMVSPAWVGTKVRRRVVAAGLSAGAMALAIGVAALFATTAPNAGARNAREDPVGRLAHLGRASAFKQASAPDSGATSPGVPASVDEPPALADPDEPAIIDHTGWDDADPFVFVQNGRYYLFTTQSDEPQNVPVRSGPAFGQWGPITDALPDLPGWAAAEVTWAPDVAQFGNHYMLYFSAQLASQAKHTMCIGDAISTNPAGPYIAASTPFICQVSLGGDIDPRVFIDDDGQPYIVWKSDQNSRSASVDTQIWSERLSSDGMHLLGPPSTIFSPDETWQGTIVEAPQLEEVNGAYDLFYSGAVFNTPGYAIGVARCAGPLGPCNDTSATPFLASNLQGWGPGEESLFTNDAGIWMVYSPWFANPSTTGPPRPVALARIGFGPTGPYLAAPYQSSGTSAGTTAASRAP